MLSESPRPHPLTIKGEHGGSDPLSGFTLLNYSRSTPPLPTSLPLTLSTEPVADL